MVSILLCPETLEKNEGYLNCLTPSTCHRWKTPSIDEYVPFIVLYPQSPIGESQFCIMPLGHWIMYLDLGLGRSFVTREYPDEYTSEKAHIYAFLSV